MSDLHIPYESVMRIPVTRRKRLLTWMKINADRGRAASRGEAVPSSLTPVELSYIWLSRSEPYLPQHLRSSEAPPSREWVKNPGKRPPKE